MSQQAMNQGPMVTNVATLADLENLVGKPLGVSSWLTVEQERINMFADATGDPQWIHIDVERAKAESPFGGPIAHGYLTLSLIVPMWSEILTVQSVTTGVNYGLNKVRFTRPVPAGARVRTSASLAALEYLPTGGAQLTVDAVIELEGSERPAVVAQALYRLFE